MPNAKLAALPLTNVHAACLHVAEAIERLADPESDPESQVRALAEIEAWGFDPLQSELTRLQPIIESLLTDDS